MEGHGCGVLLGWSVGLNLVGWNGEVVVVGSLLFVGNGERRRSRYMPGIGVGGQSGVDVVSRLYVRWASLVGGSECGETLGMR